MNENTVDELDAERAEQDELIRAYLLVQAVEWWEGERKTGWVRDLDLRGRGSKASQS